MATRGDQKETPTPGTTSPAAGLGTGLLAGLPMFRQATPPEPLTEPLTDPETGPGVTADPEDDAGAAGLYGPGNRRSPSPGTRTRTSATGDDPGAGPGATPKPPSERVTAEAVGAILALVVVAAAVVVRWRAKARLREPTDEQTEDVARPVARILLRHVPAALLNPDLVDAAIAGAAVGNYLKDGPLLLGDVVDPGVPPNLADPEREYT